MTALSFLDKASLTPVSERTKVQAFIAGLNSAWISARYWWPRHAKKYEVSTFRGQRYYEVQVGYRTWSLYDKDGYLVGWHGQGSHGYPFFESAKEKHRMPLLSRLRSPKIG